MRWNADADPSLRVCVCVLRTKMMLQPQTKPCNTPNHWLVVGQGPNRTTFLKQTAQVARRHFVLFRTAVMVRKKGWLLLQFFTNALYCPFSQHERKQLRVAIDARKRGERGKSGKPGEPLLLCACCVQELVCKEKGKRCGHVVNVFSPCMFPLPFLSFSFPFFLLSVCRFHAEVLFRSLWLCVCVCGFQRCKWTMNDLVLHEGRSVEGLQDQSMPCSHPSFLTFFSPLTCNLCASAHC